MTMFLEESLYVLLIGVPLTLAFLFAWVRTTNNTLLGIAIAALVLTVSGVILERFVVTDREAIRAQLEQIAEDVNGGDIPTIISHIHSDAAATRSLAKNNLGRYQVSGVRIAKIHELTVDRDKEPAESQIKLNAIGKIDEYSGPIAFTVTLRLEGERWKIAAYEVHLDPMHHVRKNPR